MQVRIFILLACIPLALSGCSDKESVSIDNKDSSKFEIDSVSKEVLQIFSIPFSEKYDSTCLYFYCCRNYDTTSLIEIKKHDQIISGVYYQILPEYHRFRTDYADKTSKLIFFEGYSFTIDSTEWHAIVSQAKSVLQEKIQVNSRQKITDGAIYGLLYNNQIQRGGTGDVVFENFDLFLKSIFLHKYLNLKKPIMQKKK